MAGSSIGFVGNGAETVGRAHGTLVATDYSTSPSPRHGSRKLHRWPHVESGYTARRRFLGIRGSQWFNRGIIASSSTQEIPMRISRLFCTLIIAAGATLALPGVPAGAQATLKMNISVSQNSHYGVAVDAFAREVERRTDGRYKIQNFYSGALGAERESIEALQVGTLDLTMTSTGPVPNFVPEVAILDIPFLFKDYGHARATLDGPIGQELLQKFPSKGIVALAWGENGFRHMTNNKRQVILPDDLKGLKMRTMENPVHMQAYKAFGIIPTPMAFTEVFTALQQGTVDGQENPLSVISAAKFDQVQKYMTLTGHVYSPALILMSKTVWDKLSTADKQAFLDAAKEAVKANRARIDDDERKAVADLRSKGMVIVENVDKAKFQVILVPTFADFGKKFGQENIDKIRNYK
jgi:tripartite ATP-independent transporter DctP family solute receptor